MKSNFTSQRAYAWLMRSLPLPLFLVASIVSFASIFPTSGQETLQRKMTLSVDNKNVKQVLKKMEAADPVRFVYQPQVVNTTRKVSFAVKETPIANILRRLFDNGIVYEAMGDLVVIKPMSKTSMSLPLDTIGGKITDAKTGEPLPGVNVMVKGTDQGTSADAAGKYTLIVDAANAVLVFSFVGYISQEIPMGSRSVIDVQMAPEERQLDEVVVVGYGTQKRVSMTGVVATVSGADIIKRPVTSPVTMLQGQVPGLRIVQGTGQPGKETVTINIRGQGTYSSAGSEPLILVDGVPGSLSNLNPSDIESISVLKDASSAAIYGSRGANGVLLVTTKMGKEGKLNIDFTTNVAIHAPTRMLKLVTNSADYMRMFNEARTNSGTASSSNTYTQDMINQYQNATDRTQYPNFDWLDYMFNPATVSISSLSLNGGAKGTVYNMSLGYVNQPGTMRGFSFDKFNFRTNVKSDIKPWATVGTNISMERGNIIEPRQGTTDSFLSTLAQAPTYGPVLPDGARFASKAYSFEANNKNIPAIIANKALKTTVNYDMYMQLWAELKLFKGFSWYAKGAINLASSGYKDWRPTIQLYNYRTGLPDNMLDTGGKGLISNMDKNFYTNFYTYMKYDHEFNNHEISVQAGYSQEYNRYEMLEGYRQGYATNNLFELDAGSQSVQTSKGTSNEWALQSLFGRLGYNYKDKYLAEFSARLDGTSRISKDNRWGIFPSVSAGWRISQEEFYKNSGLVKWVQDIKIRGSWGQLGNQNIGNYPYQSLLAFAGAYPYDNTDLSLGIAQQSLANQNIKWETTTGTNAGVEFRLLNRFSIIYDYYTKRTADILRKAQTAASLGLDAPVVNSGEMMNYGHEITVKYENEIKSGSMKGFAYNGSFYIDVFRNKLVKFGAREIDGNKIRENEQPYNSFYMLDWIGVFQTPEEIRTSPKQFNYAVVPGDLKYRDVNNDGKVDSNDRIIIPGRFPKFEYAFNFGASWKGFDLSLFFQGVQGRKIYVNAWGYEPFRQGTAPTQDWLTDRWTGPGTSNTLPRLTFDYDGNSQNRVENTWYLQNASYLRLKNLTLGYTLSQKGIAKIKAEKLRFYFSADNLFLITKYKYLDPERGGDGVFVQYPQNQIFSLGVNLQL